MQSGREKIIGIINPGGKVDLIHCSRFRGKKPAYPGSNHAVHVAIPTTVVLFERMKFFVEFCSRLFGGTHGTSLGYKWFVGIDR